MVAFISKAEPETLAFLESEDNLGGEHLLPNRSGVDNTPLPEAGDTMLFWKNKSGLIGEAIITSAHDDTSGDSKKLRVSIRSFARYAFPLLSDEWLRDAGREKATIASRLRTATTERGGTKLPYDGDLVEIGSARRNAVAGRVL